MKWPGGKTIKISKKNEEGAQRKLENNIKPENSNEESAMAKALNK